MVACLEFVVGDRRAIMVHFMILFFLFPWDGHCRVDSEADATPALGLLPAVEAGQEFRPRPGFCDRGWTRFGNRCFLYVRGWRNWADSESNCVSLGGNLVSVHSEDEFVFVRKLIRSKDSAGNPTWVGLTDCQQEGTWLWSDGSPVDFTRWNSGEPNEMGNEDCVHTNWSAQKGWNDISCNSEYPSVCAKKLPGFVYGPATI